MRFFKALTGHTATTLSLAVALLLALGAGCKSKIEGRFESTGGELGQWTLKPTLCYSAAAYGGSGVWLKKEGDTEHGVHVYLDSGSGKLAVGVKTPKSGKEIRLTDCKTLDGELEESAGTYAGAKSLAGKIDVDCPAHHFKGQATFRRCQ